MNNNIDELIRQKKTVIERVENLIRFGPPSKGSVAAPKPLLKRQLADLRVQLAELVESRKAHQEKAAAKAEAEQVRKQEVIRPIQSIRTPSQIEVRTEKKKGLTTTQKVAGGAVVLGLGVILFG